MPRKIVTSIALLASFSAMALACAGRSAVWKEQTQADSAPPVTTDSAASLAVKGDSLWEERADPAKLRQAIQVWEKSVASDPENSGVLVKLTRAHYFLADGYLRDKEDEYLEVMDKGVTWGEKALMAVSPEFAEKMRQGEKFQDAVSVVSKEGVPAMYWYASSLGKWAKRKGFAVLLGQKDNVKATMDLCLELDPEYFYAGPHRYFGAFFAVAPAFAGGDLEKSKVHFNKSLEMEPHYLGTKVLWAQELAVKEQDEETFERLLNEVLAAPDDGIPELVPETRVEKEKAKGLLAKKDELF